MRQGLDRRQGICYRSRNSFDQRGSVADYPLGPFEKQPSIKMLKAEPCRSSLPFRKGTGHLLVHVRDNNVDQALRALKKKLQREGVFREMKLRNFYEKPSEKKAREKGEARRRQRKLLRKRAQREGLLPHRSRG